MPTSVADPWPALLRLLLTAAGRDDAVTLVFLSVLVLTTDGLNSNPLNSHPACANFTRGNQVLKEFYSPGWPRSYPNNTNCTRTLTAPEGQLIQVDFRDSFDLEPSPNCENDYLLIRDGKEAYSQDIGRWCGHTFPKLVTSSGRHLWLSFRSDETIEYGGFRAIYSFKQAESHLEPPACRFHLTGPEAIISTDNISSSVVQYAADNSIPLDCTWRITVTPGKEIQVYFKEFVLDKPNECQQNFVEILSGPELLLTRKQYFCSSKADSVKMGRSNDVTFRFFAAYPILLSQKTNILSVVTEMRQRTSDEQCLPAEFDCDDLYCINRSLVCNGNFNCDKQLDEKASCDRNEKDHMLEFLTTDSNIVIMTIGCGLLFGMCFSMIWNCVRKLREDFREKEENIRRSRDDVLDDVAPSLMASRSRAALDEGGCYVPSIELKPQLPSPLRNGGVGIVRKEIVDTDVDTTERGNQTTPAGGRRRGSRESCASGSSTPPPPPPTRSCPHGPPISPYPEDHYDRGPAAVPPPPPPPPCGTAGLYGGSLRCDIHRPRTLPKVRAARSAPGDEPDGTVASGDTARRYRAEAVIELATRPGSLTSARSAPDVVVKI